MRDPVEELQHPQEAKEHFLHYARKEVFQLNFYRAHMLYFIICIGISSIVVYGEGLANDPGEENGTRLRYVDALFLCCSAMTTTGLNTVNLGTLTAFQQAVLCILLVIGNVVFVSAAIVLVRRYYFRKKLADIVQHSKAARRAVEDIERQESRQISSDDSLRRRHASASRANPLSQTKVDSRFPKTSKQKTPLQRTYYHQKGFGLGPTLWESRTVRTFFSRMLKNLHTQKKPQDPQYISFRPTLDSQGRIRNLSEHQRYELGGVEYRALQVLLFILIAYQLFWHILGVVMLIPYSYRSDVTNVLHTQQPGNLNPGWFAFFVVVTEFANGGLNLMNANFIPFQSYYYLLIISGALSLAGQTQFPIFLRLILWTTKKFLPEGSRLGHTLAFLLQHPRRCFIYLFPAKETWYLFVIQLVIDLGAWILFIVLNIGMPQVMSIPTGTRVFDGLFQATGLRTAGAYIINMSYLAPALLVVYLVIMYISSFPIVMALRKTNTYEERSIGLDDGEGTGGGGLAQHLRMQLAYDIWFQILAWFLICIIERGKINSAAPGFSVFAILFEVTSAYGTVGLSTGVPYDQYSLSGAFQSLSKVIMLCVMVRGRHRGLPLAIDRSILLPGEDLMHRMDAEYNKYGHVESSEEEELEKGIEESGQKRAG